MGGVNQRTLPVDILFSQMIELKLEPSVLAEAVLLVSTGTGAGQVHEGEQVKKLADQILQSIMAQPAVLEPHVGALIDWCIDFKSHGANTVRTATRTLPPKSTCFSGSPPERLQSTLQSLSAAQGGVYSTGSLSHRGYTHVYPGT